MTAYEHMLDVLRQFVAEYEQTLDPWERASTPDEEIEFQIHQWQLDFVICAITKKPWAETELGKACEYLESLDDVRMKLWARKWQTLADTLKKANGNTELMKMIVMAL